MTVGVLPLGSCCLLGFGCWPSIGASARAPAGASSTSCTFQRPSRRHRVLRRELEARGRTRATITRRLCTIAGFCRHAVEEELLDYSPAAHVRWPRLDYESKAVGLDRNELAALLVAAGPGLPGEHALICLLALNGLRVPEATGADIEALGIEHDHQTLVIKPASPGFSAGEEVLPAILDLGTDPAVVQVLDSGQVCVGERRQARGGCVLPHLLRVPRPWDHGGDAGLLDHPAQGGLCRG